MVEGDEGGERGVGYKYMERYAFKVDMCSLNICLNLRGNPEKF